MLHACVQTFDVTRNLEKFCKILKTKQAPSPTTRTPEALPASCNTHSSLHFFLHSVQTMHWCKVYIRHENYGKDCSSDETSIPN